MVTNIIIFFAFILVWTIISFWWLWCHIGYKHQEASKIKLFNLIEEVIMFPMIVLSYIVGFLNRL